MLRRKLKKQVYTFVLTQSESKKIKIARENLHEGYRVVKDEKM